MNDMSLPKLSTLDVWYSQKPTLGLMGEFSAGKSTLLNLILDDDILQTRVTATNMPVIWLTHAAKPKAESLSRDGILSEFDIDTLDQQGDQDHLVIRLSLPCPILERVDIIDTPGISDGRLAVGALEFLGPYLDCVIWCSAANQAWRQTEKAMWTSLPENLRTHSMLALTRSDTMRKKTDLQKVIRRCERETAGLFAGLFPISAVIALEAKSEGRDAPEPRKWAASHAADLFEKLDAAIEVISAECAARPRLEMPEASNEVQVESKAEASAAEKEVSAKPKAKAKKAPAAKKAAKPKAKTAPKPKAKTTPAPKAKTTAKPKATKPRKAAPKKTAKVSKTNVSTLMEQLCQLREKAPQKEQYISDLFLIVTAFAEDKTLSEGQRMVLNQTLSSDWPDTMPETTLMAQLTRELNDFADSTWYALDQIN